MNMYLEFARGGRFGGDVSADAKLCGLALVATCTEPTEMGLQFVSIRLSYSHRLLCYQSNLKQPRYKNRI